MWHCSEHVLFVYDMARGKRKAIPKSISTSLCRRSVATKSSFMLQDLTHLRSPVLKRNIYADEALLFVNVRCGAWLTLQHRAHKLRHFNDSNAWVFSPSRVPRTEAVPQLKELCAISPINNSQWFNIQNVIDSILRGIIIQLYSQPMSVLREFPTFHYKLTLKFIFVELWPPKLSSHAGLMIWFIVQFARCSSALVQFSRIKNHVRCECETHRST